MIDAYHTICARIFIKFAPTLFFGQKSPTYYLKGKFTFEIKDRMTPESITTKGIHPWWRLILMYVSIIAPVVHIKCYTTLSIVVLSVFIMDIAIKRYSCRYIKGNAVPFVTCLRGVVIGILHDFTALRVGTPSRITVMTLTLSSLHQLHPASR